MSSFAEEKLAKAFSERTLKTHGQAVTVYWKSGPGAGQSGNMTAIFEQTPIREDVGGPLARSDIERALIYGNPGYAGSPDHPLARGDVVELSGLTLEVSLVEPGAITNQAFLKKHNVE